MIDERAGVLKYAPSGAIPAKCEVCGAPTNLRLAVGDGVVPICSDEHLAAWPRVRALLDRLAAAEQSATRQARVTLHERMAAVVSQAGEMRQRAERAEGALRALVTAIEAAQREDQEESQIESTGRAAFAALDAARAVLEGVSR